MTAYDAATVDYDDPGVLYDGIVLGDVLTLVLAGADVTAELAANALSVHVATHGNSLGTLDARLNDPAALPTVEDPVDLYVGTDRLYRGTVRSTEGTEFRGGHLFAGFAAQDEGPATVVPVAAPWGVSDDPDGVATHGYESLGQATRTTEGGSPQTTYQLVVRESGLWTGMNLEVTSAVYGLAAEQFEIVEAEVSFPQPNAPQYRLTLGDPRIRLSDVVAESQVGGVVNAPATVVIDPDGLHVTEGAITVTNSGSTVIIDGTSDMFRIAATGSMNFPATAAGTTATNTVDIATGFTYMPAAMCFEDTGAAIPTPVVAVTLATGVVVSVKRSAASVVATDQTRVSFLHLNVSGPNVATPGRYFILEQVAF